MVTATQRRAGGHECFASTRLSLPFYLAGSDPLLSPQQPCWPAGCRSGVTFLAREEAVSAWVFCYCMRIEHERERDGNLLGSKDLRGAGSVCHNLLIASRDGASSGHPGGSSRGSRSPEGASIFWPSLTCHHWCSRCWPSAPRSKVWAPGVPAVPGERAGVGSWRPGLEQGHTSTWCSSYWPHPGAAVADRPRRLQHWGKFIHWEQSQRESEREPYSESSDALETCHMSSFPGNFYRLSCVWV